VLYPGRSDHPQYALAQQQMKRPSTLISFEIAGGESAAFRFANALKLILISNNLGDARSLITHPATTTHRNLSASDQDLIGVTEGLLRLSVGIEAIEDLKFDIGHAVAVMNANT